MKWIGRLFVFVGAMHALTGAIGFRGEWAGMFRRGLVDTVYAEPGYDTAFWFMALAMPLVLIGLWIAWSARRGYDVPPSLGWGLVGLAGAAVLLMPASMGWWAVLALAVALVVVRQREARTQPSLVAGGSASTPSLP